MTWHRFTDPHDGYCLYKSSEGYLIDFYWNGKFGGGRKVWTINDPDGLRCGPDCYTLAKAKRFAEIHHNQRKAAAQ